MEKTKSTLSVLAAFLFIMTCATAGQALTNRSYVAGPGVGSDTNATNGNDCSFTNPCRFFAAAYGVTNAGGEIVALTAGVGYGGLTITKAISVSGIPGQLAFVNVSASGTGFTVAAGATDQVFVRNITFNGGGAAGTTGVWHTSGKLILEHCTATQLTTGVLVQGAKADLIHCNLTKNTTGLRTNGQGCDTNQNTCNGTTAARVSFGNLTNNGTAFQQDNPGFGSCTPGFTCPPTPFPSRVSMFVFGIGGQAATNVTGNTTMSAASGTGCPEASSCQVVVYTFNSPVVNP